MKLNKLFGDDAGVSPVIGVILMVAITVILAAVIGTFVLSGDLLGEPAPQVNFDWSEGENNVTAVHDGGETIDAGELSVTGDGTNGTFSPTSGDFASGDELEIEKDGDSGVVRIVWQAEGSSSSATIGEYTLA